MSPLPGQPAAKAGVQAKDIVSTINSQSTSGMSVNDAVDKIRGPIGSKVTLGIIRGSQQLTFTIHERYDPDPNCHIKNNQWKYRLYSGESI